MSGLDGDYPTEEQQMGGRPNMIIVIVLVAAFAIVTIAMFMLLPYLLSQIPTPTLPFP